MTASLSAISFGRVALALLGPTIVAIAAPASAQPPAHAQADCFEMLEQGSGDEITCEAPLRLSAEERAELEAGSRGYVTDVACTLSIRISRSLVERAIWEDDYVFQSPQQPLVCRVTMPKRTLDITATFAPRVTIAKGEAIDASLGLDNVEGVSRVLSWPVKQFINRWPSIRVGTLQAVNAYRAHARRKRNAQRERAVTP